MRKTLAGMAAMFIAGTACAATSASYVQRGLIAQWDGIDNAGTGVHDPAATTWKNLVGGARQRAVRQRPRRAGRERRARLQDH